MNRSVCVCVTLGFLIFPASADSGSCSRRFPWEALNQVKFAYICSLSETGDICFDNFLLTHVSVLYRRRSLKDTEECRICETWTSDLRIGRFDFCRPNVCILPAKEGFVFSNGVLVIGSFVGEVQAESTPGVRGYCTLVNASHLDACFLLQRMKEHNCGRGQRFEGF
jgi:hypothetical protein